MVDANKLGALSHLAQQLNSETDNLNTYIEQVNNQLAKLNVGIECYLSRPLQGTGRQKNRHYSPPKEHEQDTYLGYDKVGEKWQLCLKTVETEYEWDPEEREQYAVTEDKYTSLVDASRDLRLLAIERFDDLLDALIAQSNRKLEVIRKAKALANSQ